MNWENDFDKMSSWDSKVYLVYIPEGSKYDNEWYKYSDGKYISCKVVKKDGEEYFKSFETGQIISKPDVKAFCKIDEASKGYRALDSNAKVCEDCDGKGKIDRSMAFKSGRVDEWTERCNNCQGDGFIESD